MVKVEKSYLPTKEITPFLDRDGIEKTWKNLLYTHASLSYPEKTARLITEAKEFSDCVAYDKDYLNGLTVGQVSIVYEYSLAHVDPDSRKESGQYFTPDDVAQWMAKHSEKFDNGVWLDPCSGLGNLSYPLAAMQEDPEKFIVERLILADMDSLALLLARSLFALKFHKKNDDLFNALKPRMVEQNFLETSDGLPEKIQVLKPDYVIVNPPYAAFKDDRWETKQARDLYAYFLEAIIKNCKGFISVTPQSYTHGSKFKVLRKLLMSHFNRVDIYNFDNVPDSVFKGIKFGSKNTNTANSVRASIIIAQKVSPKDALTRMTPLLRWVSAEREKMWKQVDSKLNAIVFTENIFPKNYEGLTKLYDEVLTDRWEPLNNLLSKTPTKYSLIVPSTPRYFISATKRTLSRSSFKELFFKTEEDRDRAYVYLNSSLLYWWWRLNDGGMTLSSDTLFTLPVEKKLTIHKDLVAKLETSERDNLVVKMNAGKPQENVKHSAELIRELNERLFKGKTAEKLLAVHKNSNF